MDTEYEVTKADLNAIAKYVFNVPEGQYSPLALVNLLQTKLTAIEQDLLLRRAADGSTYTSIAEAVGVTASRVGGIVHKAIRKLKYAQVHDKSLLFATVEYERDRYKKLYETLFASVHEGTVNKYDTTPIDVLKLSVRSYTCLTRAGKTTIGKLLAMREEDLFYIRNLGRKSVEEIVSKVDELGLSFSPAAED